MVLLGKYRVDAIIGRGGMGLVVKAWHLGLEEEVAIKLLRDDIPIDEETIARFIREAQAAVKLKSEHIARITDVGTFDDGKPYMVMELLEGQDIGQLLTERGRLQPSLAIDLVIQACEALAEAHSLGIVHRDIKPTNLFLSSRPDGSLLLKVLDFGISKSPAGAELSLTQTWSVLGSPAYMSPEQMRSARHVDGRSDIWSLGTVLYEAIEGHLPFRAESFSEMCVMVAVDPPAPMVSTPAELAAIIARCLAKDPAARYVNVAELGRDLARLAREPDKAQILVDRMRRMLARGTVRRTPPTGVPQTGAAQALYGKPPPAHRDATPVPPVSAVYGVPPAPASAVYGVPPAPASAVYGVPPASATYGVPQAPAYVPQATIAVTPHAALPRAVAVPLPSAMAGQAKRREWSWRVTLVAAVAALAAAIAVVAATRPGALGAAHPDDGPAMVRRNAVSPSPAPAAGSATTTQ